MICISCSALLSMQEVSHWADLPLDFLIIGLDGCGTTSLRRNLAKHPAAWTNQPTLHPLFGPKWLFRA